jgi:hypothetical protein
LPDDEVNEMLTLQYSRPGNLFAPSSAVTVHALVDDASTSPECLVTGHALQNGGTPLIIGPIAP